jgi:hypothetical protein
MSSGSLAHIATLKDKLAELQRMVVMLEHLAGHCYGDARPACPIMDDLAGKTDVPAPATSLVSPRDGVRRAKPNVMNAGAEGQRARLPLAADQLLFGTDRPAPSLFGVMDSIMRLQLSIIRDIFWRISGSIIMPGFIPSPFGIPRCIMRFP